MVGLLSAISLLNPCHNIGGKSTQSLQLLPGACQPQCILSHIHPRACPCQLCELVADSPAICRLPQRRVRVISHRASCASTALLTGTCPRSTHHTHAPVVMLRCALSRQAHGCGASPAAAFAAAACDLANRSMARYYDVHATSSLFYYICSLYTMSNMSRSNSQTFHKQQAKDDGFHVTQAIPLKNYIVFSCKLLAAKKTIYLSWYSREDN